MRAVLRGQFIQLRRGVPAGTFTLCGGRGGLPAEFSEAVVIDAEMVADLVDDGPADLLGDLLLRTAGRAGRPCSIVANGPPPVHTLLRLITARLRRHAR